MATASDDPAASLKVMEDDLSCFICYNLLREPKDLDCQHIYCLRCLQDWVGKKLTIECPECRRITIVPQGGLTSLKTNLRLKNMVGKYKAHVEKQKSVPLCQTHKGERQHFYCVTCRVTVCHNCLVRKHPEPQHKIEELKDVTKTWKEEMTKKLDRVSEEVHKIHADEKKLDEIETQIRSSQTLAENKIDERAKEIINQVEAKREEIKKQIQETSEQNWKKIQEEQNLIADGGKRLRNVHSALQKVVDTAADHVYMNQHVALVEKMEKLCDAKHELPTSDMACIHFNPGSDPVSSAWFGEIVNNDHQAHELKLITELGSFKLALSVATSQSGLLAVVDYVPKEVIVYRDENGEYKEQFSLGDSCDDPSGKLVRPVSVALTSGDKILIADNGPVKVFSATGKYEQTLPISGAKITTTPDDMIVVGSRYRGDIRVYKFSGELLKTHAIDSKKIVDIASNGKQIAYTTESEGKVCVIDFESGQKLWTLDMNCTLGVCYAPGSNSILVAGNAKSQGNFMIQQYCSITGRFISRLVGGLCNPHAMTTRDKNLLVACKKTVKMYHIQ